MRSSNLSDWFRTEFRDEKNSSRLILDMSDLQEDSLDAFKRLLSEQDSYLNEVEQQIKKWSKFQEDYRELETRLKSLPDRLTYDCTVPFGKLAFIPGRIVHSNEILVLLGENYFVERSCKQAIEIVHRRLANIDENLEKHKKEKELFNQQKSYTKDFLDDKTKFFEIKDDETVTTERRSKLSEDEIREQRRRLQERAMKISESQAKRVRFDDQVMEVDDNDDDETASEAMRKIFIHHTENENEPIGDPSPAVFSHPGAIGRTMNVAFTGKTIERTVVTAPTPVEPPKRISKFKASRQ